MPVKGAKLCGARCRTKGGNPCLGVSMKNGRCRMHGGVHSRKIKHGRETNEAKQQRKQEQLFLREMNKFNEQINNILGQ